MSDVVSGLKEMLDRKETARRRLQEEIDVLRSAIGIAEEELRATAQGTLALTPSPPIKQRELSPVDQRIVELMRANGGAMHRLALFAALSDEGIKFSGANPKGNFSARLSLHKEVFKPIGEGYWALLDYPKPSIREAGKK